MLRMRIALGLFTVCSALTMGAAVAQCITNVIVNKDGTHTVCTTCCMSGGMCNTTCFQDNHARLLSSLWRGDILGVIGWRNSRAYLLAINKN